MPFGPPGEWVPVAMISGTRDDTPAEKAQHVQDLGSGSVMHETSSTVRLPGVPRAQRRHSW